MPFPGTVVQRVYGQVPGKVIQLAGANWVRPLYVGTNWSRIRIGMLCTILNPSLTTIANCPLYMGLCSGKNNPVGFDRTDSFIGACLTGTANSTCTLTYTASTSNFYTGAAPTACRKYENIWTTSAAGTALVFAARGPDVVSTVVATFSKQRRTPVYIDIARGESGGGLLATINCWSTTATTAAFDYAPADFLDGLNQTGGAPIIAGQTLVVGLTAINTLYISDMLGALDSMCIYWSRAAFPLEIHAVGATVKYPSLYASSDNTHGVDAFTQYGSGTLGGRSLNSGTGWSGGAWQVAAFGTNRGNPALMASGDAGTYPFFGSYNSYGSISGTVWPFAGTQFPALWHGTVCGWPLDNFETFYSVGSITSGVTINSGSGWASPGVLT